MERLEGRLIHIVSFSGGLGSWMAAKRVAAKHGTDNLYLVFADVLMEDPDLYRFLVQAADNVGGELVILREGRDPWDVFKDVKYAGNTRIAHCSELLKTVPFYDWIRSKGWAESEFVVYLGIDWTEAHRLERARKRRPSITIEAPLCELPLEDAKSMRAALALEQIQLPELYKKGFVHNNCGGCCVKAGLGQWKKVLDLMPERYREVEERQAKLFREVPSTKPFLRKTVSGKTYYLSLKEYRIFLQLGGKVDPSSIGGCGCFSDS